MQCPKCNGERRRGATYCGECGRRLGAELDVHAGPSSFADGRYMIERRLGEGAHKVVYLARDCRLSRAVALAWFRTEGMDRAARETLEREVGAIARLGEHPNIASIYDLGEEGGRPYLVREYVDGGSVTDVMAAADGGRIDVERAVEIAAGVARALEHAHDHGVLHRDIKPANIWLDASGMVKLGDFGLAGFADHVSLSRSETVLGTVYYVAPEQARGEALDARADLYALGATLYEMLTGRPPFLGDSALAVVSQHLHAEAVAPSWLAPGVPETLDTLLLSLLAKTPQRRPPSAAALRRMLEKLPTTLPATIEAGAPMRNPLDRLASGSFIGRRRELDRLKHALDEAGRGRTRMLLVTGEPGIGKSRIVQELATFAALRGVRVLDGRCHESGGAPAYWPWTQILRRYEEQTGAAATAEDFGH
jgi:serine/threonine protein kinase